MTAAVISKLEERLVIPDHKLMFIPSYSEEEAHALCAVLNSSPVRAFIACSSIETQISTKAISNIDLNLRSRDRIAVKDLSSLSRRAHKTAQKSGEVPLDILAEIDARVSAMWLLSKKEMSAIRNLVSGSESPNTL